MTTVFVQSTINLRSFLPVLGSAFLLAIAPAVLAATPEETAREVLAKTPIIDGHNDTPHQIEIRRI